MSEFTAADAAKEIGELLGLEPANDNIVEPIIQKAIDASHKPIKQAAIKGPDGRIHTLPHPARHHEIINDIYSRTGVVVGSNYIQGFVTDGGKFVNRTEAYKVAVVAGQITKQLFSEDLW